MLADFHPALLETPMPARLLRLELEDGPSPTTDCYCVRCQRDLPAGVGSLAYVVQLQPTGPAVLDPLQVRDVELGRLEIPGLDHFQEHGWQLVGPECVRLLGDRWFAPLDTPIELPSALNR